MPVTTLIFSLAIFGAWGVVSRELPLFPPLLVALMALGGGLTARALDPRKRAILPIPRTSMLVAANLALDILLLVGAYRRLPFGVVITLHYLGPLIAQLVAPRITKEPFSAKAIALTLVGFAGGALTAAPRFDAGHPVPWLGLALALGSAFTLAGNILLQKKRMTDDDSPHRAVVQYNGVLVAMLLPVIAMGAVLWPHAWLESLSLRTVLLALAAGALVQGLAMTMFNAAIGRIRIAAITGITPLEIVFSAVFGYLLYAEKLSTTQMVGMTMVVLTVYAVSGLTNRRLWPSGEHQLHKPARRQCQ